jgi:hypothetical protein
MSTELTPRDCEGQFKPFFKVNVAACAVDHCGQQTTTKEKSRRSGGIFQEPEQKDQATLVAALLPLLMLTRLLTWLLTRILLLLARPLTATLLLAGFLVRILALLAGILIRIVTHIGISLFGSRKVTIPACGWLQRNLCSACLLEAPASMRRNFAAQCNSAWMTTPSRSPCGCRPLFPLLENGTTRRSGCRSPRRVDCCA